MEPSPSKPAVKPVGRNEACPCGSGKKYKRCHGVDAPPILGESKNPMGIDPALLPEGFDPNQIDPQWLAQFTQQLQRLPKGQMQKLQHLMSRAMQGQDVSAEAQALESLLPRDLQTLVQDPPNAAAAGSETPNDEQKKESLSKFGKFLSKLRGR